MFQLYLWLDRVRGEQKSNIVVVASADLGVGKKSLALRLADHAAHHGIRMLVVGADLRSASLTSRLAPNALLSLIDFCGTAEKLRRSSVPYGKAPLPLAWVSLEGASAIFEIMASWKLRLLLDRMKQHYYSILLDALAFLP